MFCIMALGDHKAFCLGTVEFILVCSKLNKHRVCSVSLGVYNNNSLTSLRSFFIQLRLLAPYTFEVLDVYDELDYAQGERALCLQVKSGYEKECKVCQSEFVLVRT